MSKSEINVKQYIHDAFSIADDSIVERFASAAEIVTFKKRQLLFTEGKTSPNLYILVEGALLAYTVDDDGKTIPDFIFWESGTPVYGGAKSGYIAESSISCITACRLIELPVEMIKTEILQSHSFALAFMNRQSEAVFNCIQQKRACYYSTPLKRYFWLQRTYPEWERRIPDKVLAEFLGITPVTYSRIKRRIREGKLTDGERAAYEGR